jgi:ankyrin repeat protein
MLPADTPLFVLPASFELKRRFGRSVRIDVDEKGIARDDGKGQRRLRWMDINRFVTSRGDVVAFTDGAGGQLGIPSGMKDLQLLLNIVRDRLIDAHQWRTRRYLQGPAYEVPFYQANRVAVAILATLFAIGVGLAWFNFARYFQLLVAFISSAVYFSTLPRSVVVGPSRIAFSSYVRVTTVDTTAIHSVDLRIVPSRGPIVLLRLIDGDMVELRGYGSSALAAYDRIRQVLPPVTLLSPTFERGAIKRAFDLKGATSYVATMTAVVLILIAIPLLNGRAVSEGAMFLPPSFVDRLIRLGTPVDAMDFEGRTALYNAAKTGKLEMARVLLAHGANPAINQRKHPGFTPLHVAGEYNHLEMVRLLLSAGVSPNVVNTWQQTPLMQVANLGHRQPQEHEIVAVLLAAGADVNKKDFHGFTVAHSADEPEIAWLIDVIARHGADLNATNIYGERPLDRAMRDKKPFLVRALCKAGADMDVNLSGGDHPWLFDKVLASDNDTIKLLLECGASPEFVDDVGYTPLSVAAAKHNADAVRLLLDAGADPNVSTAGVGTALRIAGIENQPQIVQLLLDHHAFPNPIFGHTTPLQLAAADGRIEIVRALIAAGANLNAQTEESASALFLAAERSRLEIVDVLLRAGADPNLAFKGRFTPLMAAMRVHSLPIAAALTAAGARQ